MKKLLSWIKWVLEMNLIDLVISEIRRVILGRMEIVELVPGLFQSSEFSKKDFSTLERLKIGAVIDLEGGLDSLPSYIGNSNYKYWLIWDQPVLPDLAQLDQVAKWGFDMWKSGKNLLVHCAAGRNRSGLVNGKILILNGMTGRDAVKLIKSKRTGALSNKVFSDYLESL
jgi:hypothetical protein